MTTRSLAPRSLLAAAALALAACSASASGDAPPAAPRASHGPMPRLVFFMNPNGMPCQMQDRILREMSGELSARAQLVYYKTTEPADLPQFGRYGIRSLPTLLVTDANGVELRRATPGIQGADQVRRLLAP